MHKHVHVIISQVMFCYVLCAASFARDYVKHSGGNVLELNLFGLRNCHLGSFVEKTLLEILNFQMKWLLTLRAEK